MLNRKHIASQKQVILVADESLTGVIGQYQNICDKLGGENLTDCLIIFKEQKLLQAQIVKSLVDIMVSAEEVIKKLPYNARLISGLNWEEDTAINIEDIIDMGRDIQKRLEKSNWGITFRKDAFAMQSFFIKVRVVVGSLKAARHFLRATSL